MEFDEFDIQTRWNCNRIQMHYNPYFKEHISNTRKAFKRIKF